MVSGHRKVDRLGDGVPVSPERFDLFFTGHGPGAVGVAAAFLRPAHEGFGGGFDTRFLPRNFQIDHRVGLRRDRRQAVQRAEDLPVHLHQPEGFPVGVLRGGDLRVPGELGIPLQPVCQEPRVFPAAEKERDPPLFGRARDQAQGQGRKHPEHSFAAQKSVQLVQPEPSDFQKILPPPDLPHCSVREDHARRLDIVPRGPVRERADPGSIHRGDSAEGRGGFRRVRRPEQPDRRFQSGHRPAQFAQAQPRLDRQHPGAAAFGKAGHPVEVGHVHQMPAERDSAADDSGLSPLDGHGDLPAAQLPKDGPRRRLAVRKRNFIRVSAKLRLVAKIFGIPFVGGINFSVHRFLPRSVSGNINPDTFVHNDLFTNFSQSPGRTLRQSSTTATSAFLWIGACGSELIDTIYLLFSIPA